MRLAPIVLALLASGCALESGKKPCGAPADCTLPFVCCTQGLGLELQGFTGPSCLSRLECGPGNFLPFLPTGSPCGRIQQGYGCEGELTCCDRTLTCQTQAECSALPFPDPAALGDDTACASDSECPSGVCCGIDFDVRAGQCKSVDQCLADVGRTLDRPDGGPIVPDGGLGLLTEELCAMAFCGEAGSVAPTPTQLERCITLFEERQGGLTPSAACQSAITDSRLMCPLALRLRGGVDPVRYGEAPILPGPCYDPAPAAHAETGPACDKLLSCGLAPSKERCVELLAGIPYDTLSRISGTEGCGFELPRMGWAPRGPSSRCREDTDCPDGNWQCLSDVTTFGLCRMRSCEDGACGLVGGTCEVGNCVESCTPVVTDRERTAAVNALASDCSGRIDLSGRTPEMACLQVGNVAGANTGRCIPAGDLGMCTGSVERLLFEGRFRSLGGYMCTATPTGTLGRFESCTPPPAGGTDPCAEQVCDPQWSVCSDPCIVLGAGARPTCPAGEACVSGWGWGTPGFCLPTCTDNAQCPSNRCLEDPIAGRYCAGR